MIHRRAGQSTVEAMLALSVITVAVAAAAYVFIGPLRQGVVGLDSDTRDLMDSHRPSAVSGKR